DGRDSRGTLWGLPPPFVGGTRSAHGQLVGPISPVVPPPSHIGRRLVERANGMPRRARRGFAARRKRLWVWRCSGRTPRGAACGPLPAGIGFPSAAYLLGLRNSSARSARPVHSLQRVPHASDRVRGVH